MKHICDKKQAYNDAVDKLLTIDRSFFHSSIVCTEPLTQSVPATQSFDLGGITLSLRIEHNSLEASPQENGEAFHTDSSYTSSESEMEFTSPTNGFEDDNIQVIRRYEMPADEQLIHSSGSHQVCKEVV